MGCVPAWSNPSTWTLAQDKLYAALVADAEDNIQAEQVATGVADVPAPGRPHAARTSHRPQVRSARSTQPHRVAPGRPTATR